MIFRKSKFFVGRKSLRQGLSVLFDQGLTSLMNFFTGVMLARSTTQEDFGYFVLGMSIIRLVVNLSNQTLLIPYTIERPGTPVQRQREFLGSLYIHGLVYCLVSSFIFMCGYAVSKMIRLDCFFSFIPILTTACLALLIKDFMRLTFLAEQRYAMNLFFGSLTNIAVLLWFILKFHYQSLDTRSAFFIFSVVLGPLTLLPLLARRGVRFTPKSWGTDFRKIWKTGKWLGAGCLTDYSAVAFWPVLITFFLGPKATAVYGICFGLATILNPLLFASQDFMRTKVVVIVHESPQRIPFIFFSTIIFLFLCYFPVVLFFAFFSRQVLAFVYGEMYSDNGVILVGCCVVFMLIALSGQALLMINALKLSKIAFWSRIIGASISLPLGIFLLPRIGLPGVVIALIGYFVINGGVWTTAVFQHLHYMRTTQ